MKTKYLIGNVGTNTTLNAKINEVKNEVPSIHNLATTTRPVNIGSQDVLRTSPSNALRTSHKDPIWPSWGRPDLTSLGHPEMTSRECPNMTFKGHPWDVDLGHPQDVLRRPPKDLQSTQTWMPQISFNFSFRTYSID